MKTRGQGTIEYLVIIAIVVVIALVVVGLLLQITSGFGVTNENSVKVSWKTASPFAIDDWTLNNGKLTLVLKNQTSETLQLNKICVSPTDCNTTPIKNIEQNAQNNITIDYTCEAGSRYAFLKNDIYIDYNKGTLANMRQNGVADIVGTCN